MRFSEIKTKLTSQDSDVLRQSLTFVTEKLTIERARASKAETRATAILAVAGILTGLIIPLTNHTLSTINQNNGLILFALFSASVLFLIKAALFSIKALWALRGQELQPDLAFNLQSLSGADSLKEEIAWKIWEYYELLPITNKRLFWTNRAQRNVFASIISLVLLATVWFLSKYAKTQLPNCLIVIAIVLLTIIVVFMDFMVERIGNLWHFK